MLFHADPDLVTRSLTRELDWLEKQARLSPPLEAFTKGNLPAPTPAATPGVTVVRSNPAQDKVLRKRDAVLQVVAGPPGTGKTQTIINLIASAVCDGQTVLFISKNNTAVDNVYDAFREQELFPGILRMGSQAKRKESVDAFRQVLVGMQHGIPLPDDQAAFDAEGLALTRAIARLEEELAEVERLKATEREMALLLRRTDEQLQESGLYRYATDLAGQITPANAAQFHPRQMIALRHLEARMAGWQEAPTDFWPRLLERFGLLERLRRRHLQMALRRFTLPACCTVTGEALPHLVDGLLRLTAIYPFLLATARHLIASEQLNGKRTADAIRTDMDRAYVAKVAHDRRHLSRRWAEIVNAAQPKRKQLQELLALYERMADGATDASVRREWWNRYGELLAVIPVICATNLSLAGTAPNEPERFDLVILDEASQSDIASLLPALYRAKRACIVGDDQQLSHISLLDVAEDERRMAAAGIYKDETLSYHRHSAFDRAMAVAGQTAYSLLDRHYRCMPAIIDFCNAHFYAGQLKVERTAPPVGHLPGGLPAQGFLLDAIPGVTEYAGRSARNSQEAERVMGLAREYIAAGLTDIGIVTPFRSQRELLEMRRRATMAREENPAIREALTAMEIGTIHTFQGGQHRLMLFSTVVAPGARAGTIRWFEENRNLLNVAISRARDVAVVVGHRETLVAAGGILAAMVSYVDGLARPAGALPPLPPGLPPERLGLMPGEAAVVRDWLNPPGAVAEVLNGGEQVLYRELQGRLQGRPVMLAPKMRVLDCLESSRLGELTQQERDYAFRAHFDVVIVGLEGFRPLMAVELDGRTHEQDPLVQARDRLKDRVCEKAGLPMLRVRWGDWGALRVVDGVIGG